VNSGRNLRDVPALFLGSASDEAFPAEAGIIGPARGPASWQRIEGSGLKEERAVPPPAR